MTAASPTPDSSTTAPAGTGTASAAPTLAVDVWSDIACPWCYIGKRKFEAGLANFAGAENVEITYHSYELAPDTPLDFDGNEVDFLAAHKGMPADQVEQMLAQMTEIASSVGLAYDFDALRHTKTLKAHEALHYAKAHGRQLEFVERLFAAYFEQGDHVGRPERLAELGGEVGLNSDDLLAALESGAYAADVQADIDQARAYGINGVPFFVLDGRYGISGAQDPAVFTQALEQVAAELRPAPVLQALGEDDAAACADGSCAVPERS